MFFLDGLSLKVSYLYFITIFFWIFIIAYNYETFDLNEVVYLDILPSCSPRFKFDDIYENVPINKSDGAFKRADQKCS